MNALQLATMVINIFWYKLNHRQQWQHQAKAQAGDFIKGFIYGFCFNYVFKRTVEYVFKL